MRVSRKKKASKTGRIPSPETIGSIFSSLFGTTNFMPDLFHWPPDSFCFAALILQKSSAYTSLINDVKSHVSAKRSGKSHERTMEDIGSDWRAAAAEDEAPPVSVNRWIKEIGTHRNVKLEALYRKRSLCKAILSLLSAADEACTGLGISLTSYQHDKFTELAEFQLLPRENGSSLCRRIHPSKARVLPKCHTAQTGLTIRSFSHFLALVSSTEVCPHWFSFCADTNRHALNLLLVPWPRTIMPKQFLATVKERISDEVERGGYGMFTFKGRKEPPLDELKALVNSAEKDVGRIDGVIFPELALTNKSVLAVSKALVRDDRFLIAGVGEPAQKNICGKNYIRFDVMLKGDEYVVQLEQSKHHRWKLDRNQIIQYGIGAALHPAANWWEHIGVGDRKLMLVTLKPWLTVCVLLCEDLARLDPLGDLVRAVGPNLVISLLMDGPQIPSRWPGRYATTLADDPGCSVLTMTSAGMARLSKGPPGVPDRSDCVALWKDAKTGVAKEILLPQGAGAVVLNIAVEYCEEWTADGRGDRGNAGHPYLAGQHPIFL